MQDLHTVYEKIFTNKLQITKH